MKKILIITFIFFYAGLFSQNYYQNLFKDAENKNGLNEYFNKNGSINAQFNMKEGKLEGEMKLYDVKGSLASTFNFKNGKYYGKAVQYDKDSNIQYEIDFKDDTIIKRKSTNYYGFSNTISSIYLWEINAETKKLLGDQFEKYLIPKGGTFYFNEIAMAYGYVTNYYKNGSKKSEGQNIKHSSKGKWIFYNENGSLKKEVIYK